MAKLGDAAVAELDDIAGKRRAPAAVEARRNAVWALCRIGTPAARPALRRALADRTISVRLAAAHAAGSSATSRGRRPGSPGAERRTAGAAEGGRGARADRQCRGGTALAGGLAEGGDRFLEHSLIYALIRINDREATLPALADPDPTVRRRADRARSDARRPFDSRRYRPALGIRRCGIAACRVDVVSKRPAWADVTQDVLRKWLAANDLTIDQERSLAALLLAFGAEESIQGLVAQSLAKPGTEPARRLLLLNVVARSRVEPLPANWLAALGQALDDTDLSIRRAAVDTVKTRKIGQFDDTLIQLGRDDTLPIDLRIAALECLAQRRPQLDSNAFALLSSQLSESTEPLVRWPRPGCWAQRTLRRPADGVDLRAAGREYDGAAAVIADLR